MTLESMCATQAPSSEATLSAVNQERGKVKGDTEAWPKPYLSKGLERLDVTSSTLRALQQNNSLACIISYPDH